MKWWFSVRRNSCAKLSLVHFDFRFPCVSIQVEKSPSEAAYQSFEFLGAQ